MVQWAPDLIEAYIRRGLRTEAERTLASFDDQANVTSRIWALAAAERCDGLLADEETFETHFAAAVARHATTETPFERARTELCLGERLRRTRRLGEARSALRSALVTFEQLGAVVWAGRALQELRATGEVAVVREIARASLTAQEIQVALLVANGSTNREAAAMLFLGPKTIEHHLGNAYRKLGIRSRTKLARVVARENWLN